MSRARWSRVKYLGFSLMVLLSLMGCGGGTNDVGAAQEPAVNPTMNNPEQSNGAEAVQRAAITFLADALEVTPADVEVVRFAAREWPDDGLGCDAESGGGSPVAGYHLLARVNDSQYDVRTNGDGSLIVRCEATTSERGDDTSPETQQARAFLAEQLNDVPDSFVLIEKKAVTWRDGSLGCPQPDEMYMMALIDGYQFIFERGNRRFYIHTDQSLDQMILCDNPEEPLN
ncbi:MAG: hypothetical protein KDD73_07510 [Anaerolineales bacterium]|nr:hypothetical protein [Anaerolineales bacterium]MCB9128804.1 hypothetical protein [Ardenticatenales bacterium]MCB9171368.1 hypothetical protein [Ardenticatenales bacterium]